MKGAKKGLKRAIRATLGLPEEPAVQERPRRHARVGTEVVIPQGLDMNPPPAPCALNGQANDRQPVQAGEPALDVTQLGALDIERAVHAALGTERRGERGELEDHGGGFLADALDSTIGRFLVEHVTAGTQCGEVSDGAVQPAAARDLLIDPAHPDVKPATVGGGFYAHESACSPVSADLEFQPRLARNVEGSPDLASALDVGRALAAALGDRVEAVRTEAPFVDGPRPSDAAGLDELIVGGGIVAELAAVLDLEQAPACGSVQAVAHLAPSHEGDRQVDTGLVEPLAADLEVALSEVELVFSIGEVAIGGDARDTRGGEGIDRTIDRGTGVAPSGLRVLDSGHLGEQVTWIDVWHQSPSSIVEGVMGAVAGADHAAPAHGFRGDVKQPETLPPVVRGIREDLSGAVYKARVDAPAHGSAEHGQTEQPVSAGDRVFQSDVTGDAPPVTPIPGIDFEGSEHSDLVLMATVPARPETAVEIARGLEHDRGIDRSGAALAPPLSGLAGHVECSTDDRECPESTAQAGHDRGGPLDDLEGILTRALAGDKLEHRSARGVAVIPAGARPEVQLVSAFITDGTESSDVAHLQPPVELNALEIAQFALAHHAQAYSAQPSVQGVVRADDAQRPGAGGAMSAMRGGVAGEDGGHLTTPPLGKCEQSERAVEVGLVAVSGDARADLGIGLRTEGIEGVLEGGVSALTRVGVGVDLIKLETEHLDERGAHGAKRAAERGRGAIIDRLVEGSYGTNNPVLPVVFAGIKAQQETSTQFVEVGNEQGGAHASAPLSTGIDRVDIAHVGVSGADLHGDVIDDGHGEVRGRQEVDYHGLSEAGHDAFGGTLNETIQGEQGSHAPAEPGQLGGRASGGHDGDLARAGLEDEHARGSSTTADDGHLVTAPAQPAPEHEAQGHDQGDGPEKDVDRMPVRPSERSHQATDQVHDATNQDERVHASILLGRIFPEVGHGVAVEAHGDRPTIRVDVDDVTVGAVAIVHGLSALALDTGGDGERGVDDPGPDAPDAALLEQSVDQHVSARQYTEQDRGEQAQVAESGRVHGSLSGSDEVEDLEHPEVTSEQTTHLIAHGGASAQGDEGGDDGIGIRASDVVQASTRHGEEKGAMRVKGPAKNIDRQGDEPHLVTPGGVTRTGVSSGVGVQPSGSVGQVPPVFGPDRGREDASPIARALLRQPELTEAGSIHEAPADTEIGLERGAVQEADSVADEGREDEDQHEHAPTLSKDTDDVNAKRKAKHLADQVRSRARRRQTEIEARERREQERAARERAEAVESLSDIGSWTREDLEDLRRQVKAEQMRRSLAQFVRGAWHVVQPGTPLEWGWHLQAVCDHLQWQLEDRAKLVAWLNKPGPRLKELPEHVRMRAADLAINLPPRSAKSLLASLADAWTWLHWPEVQIFYLSVNPRVAQESARMFRDVVSSNWYRETFSPNWEVRSDQDSLSNTGNTKGGARRSRGLSSEIIGEGCIAGHVLVATEQGDIPIAVLAAMLPEERPRVWSVIDGAVRLCRILDACTTGIRETVEVRTISGHMLECTDDHPVLTDLAGTCQAAANLTGRSVPVLQRAIDVVQRQAHALCTVRDSDADVSGMLGDVSEGRRRSGQASQEFQDRPLLFTEMCGASISASDLEGLRLVSDAVSSEVGFGDSSLLFEEVPRGGSAGQYASAAQAHAVRDLWDDVPGCSPHATLLLDAVQEQGTLERDERHGQFEFSCGPVARRVVPPDAFLDLRARREQVHDLREGSEASCEDQAAPLASRAPYRREPAEQHTGESDLVVWLLPQSYSQEQTPSSRNDQVSSVRYGNHAVRVYELEVEGGGCYFAGGILVHNCHILRVDDPHDPLDSKDAIRAAVTHYRGSVQGRVNDPRTAIRCLIMQRVDPEDLTAECFPHRLVLPMEYEPNRVGGEGKSETVYGFQDPRTTPGEIIHPRFTPAFLETERVRLMATAGGYNGLMQQRPDLSAAQRIFHREWWRWWRPEGTPAVARPPGSSDTPTRLIPWKQDARGLRTRLAFDWVELSVDTTVKDVATSDNTSICVIAGLGPDRFVWHDSTRVRSIIETVDDILAIKADYPDVVRVLIEATAVGPAVATLLQGRISGVELVNVGRDSKVARARACVPAIKSGHVYVLEGAEWVPAWLRELDEFPHGKHDDRIDSFAQVLNCHAEDAAQDPDYWKRVLGL